MVWAIFRNGTPRKKGEKVCWTLFLKKLVVTTAKMSKKILLLMIWHVAKTACKI